MIENTLERIAAALEALSPSLGGTSPSLGGTSPHEASNALIAAAVSEQDGGDAEKKKAAAAAAAKKKQATAKRKAAADKKAAAAAEPDPEPEDDGQEYSRDDIRSLVRGTRKQFRADGEDTRVNAHKAAFKALLEGGDGEGDAYTDVNDVADGDVSAFYLKVAAITA